MSGSRVDWRLEHHANHKGNSRFATDMEFRLGIGRWAERDGV